CRRAIRMTSSLRRNRPTTARVPTMLPRMAASGAIAALLWSGVGHAQEQPRSASTYAPNQFAQPAKVEVTPNQFGKPATATPTANQIMSTGPAVRSATYQPPTGRPVPAVQPLPSLNEDTASTQLQLELPGRDR